MKNYLSISEAVNFYGKSESTIRSVVRSAGKIKGVLKYETLKNGTKKIYISETYLNGLFSHGKNNNSNMSDTNTSQDMIEFLKKQIEVKDEQIESLLERQRENNILMSQLQQKVLLIEESPVPKKRWWQRRK
jgi:hypothetical protein